MRFSLQLSFVLRSVFVVCCLVTLPNGGVALQDGSTYCKTHKKVKSIDDVLMKPCMEQFFDPNVLTQLERDLATAEKTKKVNEFAKKTCSEWYEIIECYKDVEDEASECLGFDVFAVMFFRRFFNDLLDYVCQNEGKHIADYVTHGGPSCARDMMPSFKRCMVEHGIDDDTEVEPSISGDLKPFCQRMRKAMACIHQAAKENCEHDVTETMDNVTAIVLNWFPCGGLLAGLDRMEAKYMFLEGLIPAHVLAEDRKCPGGGQSVVERARESLVAAGSCLNDSYDDVSYEPTSENLKKGLQRYMGALCRKLRDSLLCIDRLLDPLKPCVDEEDRAVLSGTEDAVRKALDYVCHQDKGERIIRFIGDDGDKCLWRSRHDIHECLASKGALDTIGPRMRSGGGRPFINRFGFWILERYDADECKAVKALEWCVYESMRKRKCLVAAKLLTGLIREMEESTPCAASSKSTRASSAAACRPDTSGTGSVVVLLLFLLA